MAKCLCLCKTVKVLRLFTAHYFSVIFFFFPIVERGERMARALDASALKNSEAVDSLKSIRMK